MSDSADMQDDIADAAVEANVKRARQRAKDIEEERAEVLRILLATEAGARFFVWLVEEVCGLHRPTAGADFNPNGTHFREGARHVGLELHHRAMAHARRAYMVALVNHDPRAR